MSDDEDISVYDEVEIEDMTYDETLQVYHYPCPCGDRFEIALVDLQDESTDIAVCPSCSLMIRVIYEVVSVQCRALVPWQRSCASKKQDGKRTEEKGFSHTQRATDGEKERGWIGQDSGPGASARARA